ncbi:MAG: cytochrome c [Gammaproteobacteria bacterium]|nr:cytochrome c [Gammaproteobacteria bacterium]
MDSSQSKLKSVMMWGVAAVVAVGLIGYTLVETQVYADHQKPVDMTEIFSLQQLPEQKKIVEHASGVQYAATDQGLFVSSDGGKQWRRSYPMPLPVTMITILSDGETYAFIVGKGLHKVHPDTSQWSLINNQMGAQVVVDLFATPAGEWVAQNQFGKVILSKDGGKSWSRKDGLPKVTSEQEMRGQKLYVDKCQSCHGINGVGETYTIEALTNRDYLMAPAMDESAHAWHHTDEALIKTILEGSPRQSRMEAWGKLGVTQKDAEDLVAYMKSLWGERIKSCQGPAHMRCM